MLEKLTGVPPSAVVDVLLLDIQMKEVNGDDACRTLRERGVKTPMIAVTGVISACR